MSDDLAFLSATDLVARYRARRLSPVEATKAALAAIEKHNPRLNAFRLVDPAFALAAARDSEARWMKGAPLGPVDGVPVSIKDLILAKGWPSLRGSRLIDPDQPWRDDAPGTARLRESGAVLLGKTNTSEFGWKGVTDSPLAGITRNPWNPALTPGGSSGGAAAALASGMGALALATDGGGSIRNPAHFTGLCGIKGTFGRVPAWPASPMGSLGNVGPMARTMTDGALMMNVITQPDARDWLSLPPDGVNYLQGLEDGVAGWRVALCPDLGFAKLDPEVAALLRNAADVFRRMGAQVEDADPGIGNTTATFNTHWHVGVAASFGALPPDKLALLDPGLDDFVRLGLRISGVAFSQAQSERAAIGAKMRLFHERYDLLLLPTAAVPAFPVERRDPPGVATDDWAAWTPFSYPFNLTMQPALSVPCGFTRAGLPVGLQIVGAMYTDARVLRAGRAFERELALPLRRPAL